MSCSKTILLKYDKIDIEVYTATVKAVVLKLELKVIIGNYLVNGNTMLSGICFSTETSLDIMEI